MMIMLMVDGSWRRLLLLLLKQPNFPPLSPLQLISFSLPNFPLQPLSFPSLVWFGLVSFSVITTYIHSHTEIQNTDIGHGNKHHDHVRENKLYVICLAYTHSHSHHQQNSSLFFPVSDALRTWLVSNHVSRDEWTSARERREEEKTNRPKVQLHNYYYSLNAQLKLKLLKKM